MVKLFDQLVGGIVTAVVQTEPRTQKARVGGGEGVARVQPGQCRVDGAGIAGDRGGDGRFDVRIDQRQRQARFEQDFGRFGLRWQTAP